MPWPQRERVPLLTEREARACAWDATLEVPCRTNPPDASGNLSLFRWLLVLVAMVCIQPFEIALEWLALNVFCAATRRVGAVAEPELFRAARSYHVRGACLWCASCKAGVALRSSCQQQN